ncbi:MAG: prephenate dehydratase domain-containing protein [Longimicrobiales bacterium]
MPAPSTVPDTDVAHSPRVAYQGEPGAFSEEALRFWFGPDADPAPSRDFGAVLAAVIAGDVDFGVLPVENTLAGSVAAACDAFLRVEVDVVGEIVHPVRHQLLALPGATLDDLRSVRSHPVALDQCRRFFARNPELEVVAVDDTAGAARDVRDVGDPSRAAVASAGAGERYGLATLASDLQDRPDNQTRFWVLRGWGTPVPAPRSGARRSLLVFETHNRPGALVRVLRTLSEAGLNLAALTARPADTPWCYRFLAEIDGDLTEGAGADAVDEARNHTLELRVVGPYPVAHTGEAGLDTGPADPGEEAARIREAIDRIDGAILRLLGRRKGLATAVQALRTDDGGLLRDPAREAAVLRRAAAEARARGLPEESVRQIFWRIVEACHPGVSEPTGGR